MPPRAISQPPLSLADQISCLFAAATVLKPLSGNVLARFCSLRETPSGNLQPVLHTPWARPDLRGDKVGKTIILRIFGAGMDRTRAFESDFRTYYRPLCLYALHYLGDPDAVEDVVQESFTALWRQEKAVANVKAWLYSAVRNRSIDLLRRAGKTEPLPTDLDGPISDDEAENRSALEARLWTAVDALPEMRRKCLLLAKRDGLSYKEIAEELTLSEHTVRNHISRALETLREGGREMLDFIFSFF